MLKTFRQLLMLFFIIFSVNTAQAQDNPDVGSTPAKQAIMLDFETGMVMFEKNADEQMPTSSMSKVITMYAVFQALHEGRITLDTELTVSEKAWRMGGSKMFVEVGKSVKVSDLIQGVVVQSGNDATVVLAEGISGSEAAFVQSLNAIARKLGMNDSHFMNASGWPDPQHYSTARDLATLAYHTVTDFPEEYKYFAEKEYTFNNIRQPNRNPLLYRNVGADGIKTGHTEAGGYGLMASGTDGSRRIIMVLNGMPDEKTRAQESARLMEWGLKSFENYKLYKAGDRVEQAEVFMGKGDTVPLVIEKDLTVTIPYAVRNDLKVEVIYEGPLKAPVYKGRKAATLRVTVPRMTAFEVPLVAGETVEELGIFAAAIAKAKLVFKNGV